MRIVSLIAIVFAMLIVSLACSNSESPKDATKSLLIYKDTANNVTCYRLAGFEGISCVKDK